MYQSTSHLCVEVSLYQHPWCSADATFDHYDLTEIQRLPSKVRSMEETMEKTMEETMDFKHR